MSLDEYRRKRDPARTPEPFDAEGRRPGPTRSGAFVVHLHHATHVHYDLRLEVGGALASFAVPKGPSLEPAEKRLAMRTEDHPFRYLDFEAVIPEGNYGAGPMIVWDRGRVSYLESPIEEGLERGKIDFVLDGLKLRGRFALIHTGDRPGGAGPMSWLLVKKEDEASRAAEGRPPVTERETRSVLSGLTIDELLRAGEVEAELARLAEEAGAPLGAFDARKLSPALCALKDLPEVDPALLYELKLDGVRALAQRTEHGATLVNRRGRDETARYPELVRALEALPVRDAVLDGEIVAFDKKGQPSFQRLGRRMHLDDPRAIRAAMGEVPVLFVAFDLLALAGRDLRPLPLLARKRVLARLLPGPGIVRSLAWLDGDARPLVGFVRKHRLEGVVAKRKDAPYRCGPKRGGEWIKWKAERDDDFVVIAHTRGESGRNRLGALDLATFDDAGLLVCRGRVGSGLSEAEIDRVLGVLAPLETAPYKVRGKVESAPRGRTFVRPELVVRVRYLGFSDGDAHLRFPVYLGVRDDIAPTDCRARPPEEGAESSGSPEASAAPAREESEAPKPRITNRKKVLFPGDESLGAVARPFTKGELLDYYDAVSSALLPYLRDRPLVLVRYPDGILGKSFFQWNVPRDTPSWVPTALLPGDAPGDEERRVFLVQDRETLLYIANLAAVVLHVLPARIPKGSVKKGLPCYDRVRSDFLTIDLDPPDGVERPVERAVVLARSLAELGRSIGLEPYLKTSGQDGIHLLFPVGDGTSTETVRILAELFARLLVARHPELATLERTVGKRGDRVYVDTGQTGGHRTIVAPYSVRARPGAPVSTPIRLDELEGIDPRRLNMATVPMRLVRDGDPMAGLLSGTADVAAAIGRLGALLRL